MIAGSRGGLSPGELVLSERLLQGPELFEVLGEWKAALTPIPGARFDSENARVAPNLLPLSMSTSDALCIAFSFSIADN